MTDEAKSDKTEAGGQEPSMEDILTSIRRILSEENVDEAAADDSAAGPAVEGAPADDREDEPAMAKTESVSPEEVSPESVAAAEPAREPDTPADVPPPADGGLLELTPQMRIGKVVSTPTESASADVLAQLAKAILDRRDIVVGGKDVTLEGMVREMLGPLLHEWLDRNLPYLIERLVKKEIDSMINRAEGLGD